MSQGMEKSTMQAHVVALRTGIRLFGVLAGLLLAVVAAASAQTVPDLSGTWINLSDPNATNAQVAASLPNALLVITHQGDRFNLSRSWSNAPILEAHVCDGRENKNGYSQTVERSKCRWDSAGGGTLIIEGTIGRDDGTVVGTFRNKYSLDKDGVLVVERMRRVDRAAASGTPYTQRYRKLPQHSGTSPK